MNEKLGWFAFDSGDAVADCPTDSSDIEGATFPCDQIVGAQKVGNVAG